MVSDTDLLNVIHTSVNAGKAIMKVYGSSDFQIEKKSDASPLTVADKLSHDTIVKGLNALIVDYPILSEEGSHLGYDERQKWERFWLVDPLDGTKEFIKRNGEFTVNIALIHKGKPVFGVVYVPVSDTVYVGDGDRGSYKIEKVSEGSYSSYKSLIESESGHRLPLHVRKEGTITAVASRSHPSPETKEFLDGLKEQYGKVAVASAGSSLKLCLVAEGAADVYPRFAPTMEWDTAAGHAVVQGAGGKVVHSTNSTGDRHLEYNKKDLTNPWFIVWRQGLR
ncbi:3'(2'),5'-bisphosphate nucleotidase CysQ [Alkalihalobacillus sp. CinArs1]|uniref:3'(2'),5'-bisphosphate nucleotidase CysQ n=1 Tax=Alkalihalobacillus sp. CinArs1 TaxID=2995314 RepID=UPI0022DD88C0|nr:3'(2'),5'-bisphosphate nucleotidase CysQ [Alkalihalobacillus sp. CinArs1]